LGFSKEAEEYLNKAEEFENPHENVFKAISAIKSKITEEKELEEKILKKANRKYRFFNHFGNAIFTSKLLKFKIRINGI
jgi:predicted ribosome quality control (RQC) complex YloA/Tae2 family protein